MAESIIDANILVAVFRGDAKLAAFVERLDCAIDITIYVELIQGSKNKAEVTRIRRALDQFRYFFITRAFRDARLI